MSQKKKGKSKTSKKSSGPYPFEFRLRVVRMYLEEKYPPRLISEVTGVGRSTVNNWVRRYRQYGEDGLREKLIPSSRSPRLEPAVKNKIIEVKKSNPVFGVRRISDFLKCFFLLKASPATVHKELIEAALVDKKRPKQQKNPPSRVFLNVPSRTSSGRVISAHSAWPGRTPT